MGFLDYVYEKALLYYVKSEDGLAQLEYQYEQKWV